MKQQAGDGRNDATSSSSSEPTGSDINRNISNGSDSSSQSQKKAAVMVSIPVKSIVNPISPAATLSARSPLCRINPLQVNAMNLQGVNSGIESASSLVLRWRREESQGQASKRAICDHFCHEVRGFTMLEICKVPKTLTKLTHWPCSLSLF